ncbi:MAG TPA: efflux RND transporter periplasmic adaptor subunit [Anaerolineaceae bacterium]|nr:efflux RND transporter periplasmic adaptor subunit [Anaerolineaceae bacterium]HPN52002.1 efflux RND transporter periplasmic adaptor subunit [Anaerolineaceae bacterium]
MKINKIIFILCAAIMLLSLPGCAGITGSAPGALTASGKVTANEVNIAAEIGGRVVEINVKEGDSVKAGDVLFRTDDEILRAQLAQAQAAVHTAETALSAAKAQADGARIQEQIVLQGARMQDQRARATAWQSTQPEEFNLPAWYYQKTELTRAAEEEVKSAETNLAEQKENLNKALSKSSAADFLDTEQRLANAQAAYAVAKQILDQAKTAKDSKTLVDAATDLHDEALKELETVQLEYRRMLTTTAAEDILEARAHVALAQTRLDTARDQFTALQSGEQSLQVEAARSAVTQADSAVATAEANLAQAKAALDMLNIQLEKTAVRAPVAGVILTRSLELGEIAAPGGIVMTIGQLDEVELVVYIPESEYGRVKIGQTVAISVDSFQGKTFEGSVLAIANEAEFTPRNVQTVEGRKTTVYAVKISAPNPDQSLKPGMPADVTFQ